MKKKDKKKDKEHLEAEVSDRGFKHMAPIPSGYGGEVYVYESSAAGSGPHVWLRVVQPQDLNNPGNGKIIDATAHLSAENALKVADQLRWLVKNHYQLREG